MGSMVTVAFTDLVGSATEVAVIVTIPPVGIEVGAVYTIWPALAVRVGLGRPDCKDPQAPAVAQLKLQFTPAAVVSLVTVAESRAVPFTPSSAGGAIERAIVIGSGAIGIVTLEEIEGSLAAIALIVTELPTGCMGGAVKTVDVP
jgi:hypothetical protein